MIDIIWRGILIGIFVSAPLGPISLLCIQRTLHKGRWSGFSSGIGAACSDFLYAFITCMGMGIVIDFIEHNQLILKFVGSIFFIFFGIYIYRSKPSRSLQNTKHTYSYSQDAVSAFFLTLSNPLIIFLFIILFARFNFISRDDKMYSIMVGMASIMVGALVWWFSLSFIIGKLRWAFNERGLLIMSRTLGIVIFVLSAIGIGMSIWEFYQLYVT